MFSSLVSNRSKVKTECFSITGLRSNNEDYCVVRRLGKDSFFLAVADGMGGKEGGEIASRIALDSVAEFLSEEFLRENNDERLKELMAKAFLVAQTTIADYVSSYPKFRGMGTTMVAVLVCNGKYVCGSIGDSRMYLFSNFQVHQITEDHTYIQDFIKTQKGTLPSAIIKRYQNAVTKIIDGGSDRPDIYPLSAEKADLKDGDVILLCSDGLIPDKICDYSDFFKESICKTFSMKKISRNLVNWALANGSEDNISVVLCSYGSKNCKSNAEAEQAEQKTIRILPKGNEDE